MRYFLNIDILGVCNLACPTCPQSAEKLLPRQLMSLELLERILDKAQRESNISGVGLFNWTEPLLHPHCALLVTEVVRRGLPCHLSTNLNDIRNLEDTLKANPTSLRISLSGWTQESYGKTHTKGNIETVRANMQHLVGLLHETEATTRINVLWHRYRHNAQEEAAARAACEWAGFTFETCEAYLMPLERVIPLGNEMERPAIVDRLLTPVDDALAKCRKLTSEPCRLQSREITIDCVGNVHLCCALYDPQLSCIGRYLDLSLEQIQFAKLTSSVCSSCIKSGGHAYATFLWKPKEKWRNRIANLVRQFEP